MSKHLIREVDNLKTDTVSLATRVEEALRAAVKSLTTRDIGAAEKVIAEDQLIDRAEVDIEEECLKIMALHQPVAIDLRVVVAILKINNDLERIGDLAVNIAERAVVLSKYPDIPTKFDFKGMGDKVQVMVRQSLDSLVGLDSELAQQVLKSDDIVDAVHREMYSQVRSEIAARPDQVDYYIQLLAVSRNLERVADHATNIAEDVIYLVDGQIVRHSNGK